jgi:hypothetical protein
MTDDTPTVGARANRRAAARGLRAVQARLYAAATGLAEISGQLHDDNALRLASLSRGTARYAKTFNRIVNNLLRTGGGLQ